MYPHSPSPYKTPDAWTSYTLKTIHDSGLNAGRMLAAEERHREAQQYAAQCLTTHPDHEKAPHAWRRWSGKLLVRAGHRLQGATPTLGADIQPATH
jgi:hypothetical protein